MQFVVNLMKFLLGTLPAVPFEEWRALTFLQDKVQEKSNLRLKFVPMKQCIILLYIVSTNQLEQVLPVVLRHESEEGQEGPAEGVVAGVAVVGVSPSLYARESFWALPINSGG